ncbi:MAG: membrane integrity-associated transporter subunit PqiC [Methylophilus methylotrophus]|uniref:Membrane integrity-associated transporter subunit PqiC n=1 Tax=Methylophilus methylotrophus TaxID=17 RepID=A0A5C7WMZ0_METME|nr:MAG: membrane integrity-associated transporter subunit PqiC [Methylophilus methylotrophus]
MLLMLTLSLSACFQSNPPVKTERYSLPEVSAPQQASPSVSTTTYTLLLNRIQLADYLDTDRIVIQLDDITMRPARDHLWVDNLSQELRRGLRTRLASRLDHVTVVDPQPGLAASTNSLNITIDQFHGHMQGYAVLSGQWQSEGSSLPPQSFRFTTPLAEDGYPALVRALGHNLDLLCDQIAKQWHPSP